MTNQLPRVHEIEHHAAERATTRPVVSGMQGVVAAGHPLVSMAGMRMLMTGGNAFDAAAAAGCEHRRVPPARPRSNSDGTGTRRASVVHGARRRRRVSHAAGDIRYEAA